MISIIKTGINATNKDLAVISNNIANVSTNGFKRSDADFESMYFSEHNNSTHKARGMGVNTKKPRQSFSQGSLQQTNGSLDLAIMGEGFFVIGSPIGSTVANQPLKYTRDGSFQIDRLGNIVNNDGLPILGQSEKPITVVTKIIMENGKIFNQNKVPVVDEKGDQITVPGITTGIFSLNMSELQVRDNGNIDVTYGKNDLTITVGKLLIADFVNEHGLKNIGNARFTETPESGEPIFGEPKLNNIGKILPGHLEKSNTDITSELVKMLKTQHAFSGISKVLQTDVDTIKKFTT